LNKYYRDSKSFDVSLDSDLYKSEISGFKQSHNEDSKQQELENSKEIEKVKLL